MNFKDYINSLPNDPTTERMRKIREIAEKCCVNVNTVYRWTYGFAPDALKRKTIAEMVGIPEEELFPSNDDAEK